MALVKVTGNNLFSGANLRKLEVGSEVEVDRSTAHRWKSAGLVEIIVDEDRVLEAASPGSDAEEQPEQPEQPDTTAKSKKGK
ncbi:hypothetical protein AWI33_03455 [Klebsiella aerogenes]|uniref:hypothetical protein n=1 Tax=Klebsiella aerogenes TaxID=548 RepID=UPI0005EF0CA1|nr:hypothetical protein [Klebsiella aerogenes]KJP44265.1 hypothetical protein SR70_02770 [Klebsiella aerogenes]KUR06404.1 hypothetical protein AWI33_03455 [Klebsiella aerogenes]KUR21573.1 hypothetical protein AWI37_04755 [Klebsiella aerogenes]